MASKVAHNRPRPFYFTVQPRPQPTAQNWFFISWNLGTRHLFSYLWFTLPNMCRWMYPELLKKCRLIWHIFWRMKKHFKIKQPLTHWFHSLSNWSFGQHFLIDKLKNPDPIWREFSITKIQIVRLGVTDIFLIWKLH